MILGSRTGSPCIPGSINQATTVFDACHYDKNTPKWPLVRAGEGSTVTPLSRNKQHCCCCAVAVDACSMHSNYAEVVCAAQSNR